MKKVLVDLLKASGFEAAAATDPMYGSCNGLFLRREWLEEVEVCWYGKQRRSYDVEVFVNQDSGICRVTYRNDGRIVKSRWYDTVGKRTYNAIVETVQFAGFAM